MARPKKSSKSKLVCDALTMALRSRGKPVGVIVHTDRGSQYCSKDHQRIIEGHRLKSSMLRDRLPFIY